MSIELELQVFGMRHADDDMTLLADHPGIVAHYDVELRAVHRESGEIEVIYEREGLTADEANRESAALERIFPHAAFEAIP